MKVLKNTTIAFNMTNVAAWRSVIMVWFSWINNLPPTEATTLLSLFWELCFAQQHVEMIELVVGSQSVCLWCCPLPKEKMKKKKNKSIMWRELTGRGSSRCKEQEEHSFTASQLSTSVPAIFSDAKILFASVSVLIEGLKQGVNHWILYTPSYYNCFNKGHNLQSSKDWLSLMYISVQWPIMGESVSVIYRL